MNSEYDKIYENLRMSLTCRFGVFSVNFKNTSHLFLVLLLLNLKMHLFCGYCFFFQPVFFAANKQTYFLLIFFLFIFTYFHFRATHLILLVLLLISFFENNNGKRLRQQGGFKAEQGREMLTIVICRNQSVNGVGNRCCYTCSDKFW